jgi:hypothetical protein
MARKLLAVIGWISILAGIAIFFIAIAVIRPKVVDLSHQLGATLDSVDHASTVLGSNSTLLDAPLNVLQSAGRAASLLPETLISLQGTLTEASNALIAAKQTSAQAEKGVTGLVLPKQQLTTTNTHLDGAADQLKLLAGMVNQLIAPSRDVARNTGALARELTQLRARLGPTADLLQRSRSLIRDLRETMAFANLPMLVVLVGLALGGLYFLLGCALVSLATVLKRMPSQLAARGAVTEEEPGRAA